MTDDDHVTHVELAERLQQSIHRLREDIKSRSDPLLSEVAHALELVHDLSRHAHDHALQNRERLAVLEAKLEAERGIEPGVKPGVEPVAEPGAEPGAEPQNGD